jgi:phosphoglycerate dehydrogenase-like enzyme
VQCHAGADELPAFLARTDILVCLLPLTDSTRGFLDARLFSLLPAGAGLVHVGRGPQLVDAHLLAALASGQIGDAVLDVTDPEPLPPEHAFWRHPRIRLTPHIASMTQPLRSRRADGRPGRSRARVLSRRSKRPIEAPIETPKRPTARSAADAAHNRSLLRGAPPKQHHLARCAA